MLPCCLVTSLFLALVGCGDKDSGANPGDDADGDGVLAEIDCDDADATVHPGADELCNERDDDCDEAVDEAPTDGLAVWIDADGDGAGNPSYSAQACTIPAGWVDNADDCDDSAAVSFPGADELCDGMDNDCDLEVDESPVDSPLYYVDEDGDGFGDPEVPIRACGAPGIYVTNGDDCDDTDAALNPDTKWFGDVDADGYGGQVYAAFGCDMPPGHVGNDEDCDDADPLVSPEGQEVCDEADNDCDGEVDGPLASDAVPFYEDLDGDGFGDDGVIRMDCVAPDGFSASPGDCATADPEVSPGSLEHCGNLIDDDCDDITDQYCGYDLTLADALWDGETASDFAGYAVSARGDWDGDGIDDVATGAYGADMAASFAGRSYVMLGPVTAGSGSLADADVTVDGATESDYSGYSLGLGPDITGDGYGDLVVGAWGYNFDTYYDVGGAFVMAGPDTGSLGVGSAVASIRGSASYDYLSQYEVLVGADLDDDGQGDLVLGCSGEDTPYSSGGLIAVFFGPVGGEMDHEDADVRVESTVGAQYVGFNAAIDDINADGVDDLAWGASGSVSVHMLYGPLAGILDGADADVTILGDIGTSFGSDIQLGDYDGDGHGDVATAAKYDATVATNGGAWMAFSGPFATDLVAADAVFKVQELSEAAYFGSQYMSASTADVNGDGADDLALGSTNAALAGSSTDGAVYLFTGPLVGATDTSLAALTYQSSSSSGILGYGIDLSDVDGDGEIDAILGDRGWGGSAGRVQVVLGAGF